MQAIQTKYLPATNYRPSRMVAISGDGRHRMVISYDSAVHDMHEFAAYSLMQKMNWPNRLVGGGLKNSEVWVMLPIGDDKGLHYERYFAALTQGLILPDVYEGKV